MSHAHARPPCAESHRRVVRTCPRALRPNHPHDWCGSAGSGVNAGLGEEVEAGVERGEEEQAEGSGVSAGLGEEVEVAEPEVAERAKVVEQHSTSGVPVAQPSAHPSSSSTGRRLSGSGSPTGSAWQEIGKRADERQRWNEKPYRE